MPSVVVDASALVEVLAATPLAAAVDAATAGADLVAPQHLGVEVLSALAGLERRGVITPARAAEAVTDLLDLPVVRVATEGLLLDGWALRANVSAYDAAYVVLARRLGCPLVTADRRLAAAPGLGVAVTVVS